MAQNLVYDFTQKLVREWPVASGILSGAPVLSVSKEPGVTITARSDATKTDTLPDGSTITYAIGSAGQTAGSATVATDGSWFFPVIGASATTPKNTKVYQIEASGLLTLTVGTTPVNASFGVVDSNLGTALAAKTTVKIGA